LCGGGPPPPKNYNPVWAGREERKEYKQGENNKNWAGQF
jgi:hypothetical protein